MLAEHLTQTHDRASRRSQLIDQHVAWIHQALLGEQPTHVLDLGCGPGLYTSRLAELGHACVGIDYSPASIAYAQESAKQANLACTYRHADMRSVDYASNHGSGYGLAMLLFGEFNVFSPSDATNILAKAYQALAPSGLLLLEPHLYASLVPEQQAMNTWFSSTGGLFSPTPHLVLIEQHLNEAQAVLTRRYFVIDAATSAVTRYAQSFQAYTTIQYQQLLTDAGFIDIEILPGLAHDRIPLHQSFKPS
jgi:SAM-dependent methyltransferase